MTEEETAIYGNRFPSGYQKLQLLGKGGCALVWLGKKSDSEEKLACKQFAKQASLESCQAEIEIGQMLFTDKGEPRDNPKDFPGVLSIAGLKQIIKEPKDVWVIYEVGGSSLTKLLFEVKGEFYKGERIYRVDHLPFYKQLKQNQKLLKEILKKMLQALDVLQYRSIVHADIKPDNILIESKGDSISSLKLIDFGSAFQFSSHCSLRMSTPEYLAPECLEHSGAQPNHGMSGNGSRMSISQTKARENHFEIAHPWSIDMWSLGAVFLEILTGFPLWLSLKGRVVTEEGKCIISHGLFAVQGKTSAKIVQKQKEVIANINEVLHKFSCFVTDPKGIDLLLRMLDMNSKTRISPQEALKHPYLEGV